MKRFCRLFILFLIAIVGGFIAICFNGNKIMASNVNVSYTNANYNSSIYDNTLISSFNKDMISSIDVSVVGGATAGTRVNAGLSTSRYVFSFGNVLAYSSSPSRNYSYLASFNCRRVSLSPSNGYYSFTDYKGVIQAIPVEQPSDPNADPIAYGIQCRLWNNNNNYYSSIDYYSDNPYSYTSVTTTTASSSGTNIYVLLDTYDYSVYLTTTSRKYIGIVQNSTDVSLGTLLYQNKSQFLTNSATGLSAGSYTSGVGNDVAERSCSTNMKLLGMVSYAGYTYSSTLFDVPLQLSNDSSYCVLSSDVFYSFGGNITFEHLTAEEFDDFTNSLFLNSDYVCSSFTSCPYSTAMVSFENSGTNGSYVYWNDIFTYDIKFHFNFTYSFNWGYNIIVYRPNVYSNSTYYNSESRYFQPYKFSLSGNEDVYSYVNTDVITGTANYLYTTDYYIFPNSNYVEIWLKSRKNDNFITSNTSGPSFFRDYISLNFNFAYVVSSDNVYYGFAYGTRYKDCKWYDLLCNLQNGFTYVIYEMPVISPIINFVHSGISSITSFGSFFNTFNNNAGFGLLFGFISVPITWLVIKKIMGGDD